MLKFKMARLKCPEACRHVLALGKMKPISCFLLSSVLVSPLTSLPSSLKGPKSCLRLEMGPA